MQYIQHVFIMFSLPLSVFYLLYIISDDNSQQYKIKLQRQGENGAQHKLKGNKP